MKLNKDKLIISPQTILKEAMQVLSAGRGRVLFVVDEKEKLVGSVTDGDIRRSILNGVSFESPTSEIMFKSPRFVRLSQKDFRDKAQQLIIEERIYTIPVLDDADRIVDILFWYDFLENHPHEDHSKHPLKNYVVIMAGGKGTRLDPFTKILPKPLIPFGDKPIIEKIMDNFHKHGFNNFILVLNYKKDLIKSYFRENQVPYNVEWVEEEEYLGTAGGLGLLKEKLKDTFYVCNCDVFLENNFKDILLWHKGEKALMTLIGCHREMTFPYGTLKVSDGHLKSINEKPKFDTIINTGVYLLEPEALSLISADEKIDMNNLIERTIKKAKVSVFPVCDGWFDIGQWKEYKESLNLLRSDDEIEA